MVTIHCAICGKEKEVKKYLARPGATCSYECKGKEMTRRWEAAIEERFGQPPAALLHRLYLEEKRPTTQIAAMLEMTGGAGRVWRLLRRYRIQGRGMGEAIAASWEGDEDRRRAWGETIRRYKRANPEAAREHSIIGNQALGERQGPTSLESALMGGLEAAGIPFEFRHEVGGKFLCDFLIPPARLIVECDGYWHTRERQQRRDASKDAYLRACGYTVLRFTDRRIKHHLAECISLIGQAQATLSTGS